MDFEHARVTSHIYMSIEIFAFYTTKAETLRAENRTPQRLTISSVNKK